MSCAFFDHRQNGSHHAAYRPDFLAVHVLRSRDGKEVPEQFVGPVNQINIHAAPISIRKRCYTNRLRYDMNVSSPHGLACDSRRKDPSSLPEKYVTVLEDFLNER
jgi:hypothetical protein